MLTPSHTVPHIVTGEVIGACGAKCWPMLADSAECMHLWVSGQYMAGVQLDLAGIEALQALLADAAGRMRAAVAGAPAGVAGATSAGARQNFNEINSLQVAERAGFEPAGGC